MKDEHREVSYKGYQRVPIKKKQMYIEETHFGLNCRNKVAITFPEIKGRSFHIGKHGISLDPHGPIRLVGSIDSGRSKWRSGMKPCFQIGEWRLDEHFNDPII
jgi:hypothetical protein